MSVDKTLTEETFADNGVRTSSFKKIIIHFTIQQEQAVIQPVLLVRLLERALILYVTVLV